MKYRFWSLVMRKSVILILFLYLSLFASDWYSKENKALGWYHYYIAAWDPLGSVWMNKLLMLM